MLKRLLLTATALLAPTAAFAEWREAETAHFRVFSGGPEKQIAQFARRLESVDALMRRANGVQPSGVNKVRIYLVDGLQDVQRALGMVGSSVGGFYTVNEHGPFAVVPRSTGNDLGAFTNEVVLFHEYGHHFQLQYFPKAYPGWYVEGSAELFSTAAFQPDGKVIYGRAASHRGQSLSYARWLPIEDLLTKSADEYPDDADFYGQSWLLTHYLTFSPQRKGQLRAYLDAIDSGKTPAQAASVFGNLRTLSGEVRRYFEAANFPARAVPIDLPAQIIEKTRILSKGEEALIAETIAYRDHSFDEIAKDKDRVKEHRERADYLVRLRRKVARFATDPYALRLLADAEYVAGDHTASRATVDRLLAIDPQNQGGMYRKGMLLLDAAKKASGSEKSTLIKEGRRLTVRANHADQYDPQPLIGYYKSFKIAGEPLSKVAVKGLEDAVSFVPQDDGPRWLLVEQLADDKRFKEAAVQIGPIAFSPHKSPSRARALKRLEDFKKELGTNGTAS